VAIVLDYWPSDFTSRFAKASYRAYAFSLDSRCSYFLAFGTMHVYRGIVF
jgi:hypothetical protein